MMYKSTRRGFTLIELLVVVLIIGILAAVAVPQYQQAVDKSRFATLMALVKTVADAKSEYYLTTGEHARTFDVLSLELPAEFTIVDDNSYGQQARGKHKRISLDASQHRVVGQLLLSDNSEVLYYMPLSEIGGDFVCASKPDKRGEAFCKRLPGAVFAGIGSGHAWYTLQK